MYNYTISPSSSLLLQRLSTFSKVFRFDTAKSDISLLVSPSKQDQVSYILNGISLPILIIITWFIWFILILLFKRFHWMRILCPNYALGGRYKPSSIKVEYDDQSSSGGGAKQTELVTVVENNELFIQGEQRDLDRYKILQKQMKRIRKCSIITMFVYMMVCVIATIFLSFIYTSYNHVITKAHHIHYSITTSIESVTQMYNNGDDVLSYQQNLISSLAAGEFQDCLDTPLLKNSIEQLRESLFHLGSSYLLTSDFEKLDDTLKFAKSLIDDFQTFMGGLPYLFWISVASMHIATLICIFFLEATMSAYFDEESKNKWIVDNVLLPLFTSASLINCISVIILCYLIMMTADFCVGDMGNPTDVILDILRRRGYGDSNMYTNIKFILEGCTLGDPIENINTLNNNLRDSVTSAEAFLFYIPRDFHDNCPGYRTVEDDILPFIDVGNRILPFASATVDSLQCKKTHYNYVGMTGYEICSNFPNYVFWSIILVAILVFATMFIITFNKAWTTDVNLLLKLNDEDENFLPDDDNDVGEDIVYNSPYVRKLTGSLRMVKLNNFWQKYDAGFFLRDNLKRVPYRPESAVNWYQEEYPNSEYKSSEMRDRNIDNVGDTAAAVTHRDFQKQLVTGLQKNKKKNKLTNSEDMVFSNRHENKGGLSMLNFLKSREGNDDIVIEERIKKKTTGRIHDEADLKDKLNRDTMKYMDGRNVKSLLNSPKATKQDDEKVLELKSSRKKNAHAAVFDRKKRIHSKPNRKTSRIDDEEGNVMKNLPNHTSVEKKKNDIVDNSGLGRFRMIEPPRKNNRINNKKSSTHNDFHIESKDPYFSTADGKVVKTGLKKGIASNIRNQSKMRNGRNEDALYYENGAYYQDIDKPIHKIDVQDDMKRNKYKDDKSCDLDQSNLSHSRNRDPMHDEEHVQPISALEPKSRHHEDVKRFRKKETNEITSHVDSNCVSNQPNSYNPNLLHEESKVSPFEVDYPSAKRRSHADVQASPDFINATKYSSHVPPSIVNDSYEENLTRRNSNIEITDNEILSKNPNEYVFCGQVYSFDDRYDVDSNSPYHNDQIDEFQQEVSNYEDNPEYIRDELSEHHLMNTSARHIEDTWGSDNQSVTEEVGEELDHIMSKYNISMNSNSDILDKTDRNRYEYGDYDSRYHQSDQYITDGEDDNVEYNSEPDQLEEEIMHHSQKYTDPRIEDDAWEGIVEGRFEENFEKGYNQSLTQDYGNNSRQNDRIEFGGNPWDDYVHNNYKPSFAQFGNGKASYQFDGSSQNQGYQDLNQMNVTHYDEMNEGFKDRVNTYTPKINNNVLPQQFYEQPQLNYALQGYHNQMGMNTSYNSTTTDLLNSKGRSDRSSPRSDHIRTNISYNNNNTTELLNSKVRSDRSSPQNHYQMKKNNSYNSTTTELINSKVRSDRSSPRRERSSKHAKDYRRDDDDYEESDSDEYSDSYYSEYSRDPNRRHPSSYRSDYTGSTRDTSRYTSSYRSDYTGSTQDSSKYPSSYRSDYTGTEYSSSYRSDYTGSTRDTSRYTSSYRSDYY